MTPDAFGRASSAPWKSFVPMMRRTGLASRLAAVGEASGRGLGFPLDAQATELDAAKIANNAREP